MNQKTVEYGKPEINETVNVKTTGILTRILGYEFNRQHGSANTDRTGVKTNFVILPFTESINKRNSELNVSFNGFIGQEVVGRIVSYEDITIERRTYFDPKGRENDPDYRRGRIDMERVQILGTPAAIFGDNSYPFPRYVSKETSQYSIS